VSIKTFRVKDVEIEGYYFIAIEGLYWHSGYFWQDEKQLPIVNNNGSKAVLLNGSKKKSIKVLKKQALTCKIKLLKERMPF
jgi:hypothetical protein